MAFDFAKAEKQAIAKPKAKPLAALVLGPSSGGKSYLAGTFAGKVLYLYHRREDHGVDSARIEGAENIVEVCVEIDEEGKLLGQDAGYKRVLSILSDIEGIRQAGFGLVVYDSLSELEQLVRSTAQWKTDCINKDGNHNGFAEPAATVKAIQPVLDALRALQRETQVNYYATCILDCKRLDADDGEILESEPQLLGYKVATTLLPTFPDQIVVGRMRDPSGKITHRLQFQAGVSKTSVDQKTKEIKKFMNFTPRLRGVPSDKLPRHMKADLEEVLKLKRGEKK